MTTIAVLLSGNGSSTKASANKLSDTNGGCGNTAWRRLNLKVTTLYLAQVYNGELASKRAYCYTEDAAYKWAYGKMACGEFARFTVKPIEGYMYTEGFYPKHQQMAHAR